MADLTLLTWDEMNKANNIILNSDPHLNIIPYGFPYRVNKNGANKFQLTQVSQELTSLFKNEVFGSANIKKISPPLVVASSSPSTSSEVLGRFDVTFRGYILVNLEDINVFRDSFNIYMKPNWEGMVFAPEFVLVCKLPKVEGETNYGFQIDFTINLPVQPGYITTYLWDEDPEGSRGTVTTVQSGG